MVGGIVGHVILVSTSVREAFIKKKMTFVILGGLGVTFVLLVEALMRSIAGPPTGLKDEIEFNHESISVV